MFRTRVTQLFGIQHPIVCGGMQWVSRAELVAAVANAGAIGFITALSMENPEQLRAEIRKARSLTDKPIGVNVTLLPTARPVPIDEFFDVALEEGVDAIETSGRISEAQVARIKRGKAKHLHKVARLRDAVTSQRLGVDAVAIVGYECGGHPSMEEVGTVVLAPEVVDAVSIPVIAGGGFADARGLVMALAMGAEGVLMGTRFMATKESIVHPNLKEWMVQAKETDTALVQKSIRNPARVIRNKTADKVLEMEARGTTLQELLPLISGLVGRKVLAEGQIDAGTVACGQSVGLVHDIPTVKELVDRIVGDAEQIVKRLAATVN
ncbi:MAG: nitronate monooxygenase [Chloroflexi bacterium]|nr:nitronate monooxygenase [Chloroflexota bacterium]